MDYARDTLANLAESLNLDSEVLQNAQDIISEFLRKNKEWNSDNIIHSRFDLFYLPQFMHLNQNFAVITFQKIFWWLAVALMLHFNSKKDYIYKCKINDFHRFGWSIL